MLDTCLATIKHGILRALLLALLTASVPTWAADSSLHFDSANQNTKGIIDIALDKQDRLHILTSSHLVVLNSNGAELSRIALDKPPEYSFQSFHSIRVDDQGRVYLLGAYWVEGGGLSGRAGVFTINPSNQLEIIPTPFAESENSIRLVDINNAGDLFALLSGPEGFYLIRQSPDGQFMNFGPTIPYSSLVPKLRLGKFNDAFLLTRQSNGYTYKQEIFHIDQQGVSRKLWHSNVGELNPPLPVISDYSVNTFGELILLEDAKQDNWRVFRRNPPGLLHQIIDATGDGTGAVETTVVSDFGHITYSYDMSGNPLVQPVASTTDVLGNFYVAGQISRNVFKIDRDGRIEQLIDASGDGLGNTLDRPQRVAVDSKGNVYVVSAAEVIFRVPNDYISPTAAYLASLLYENKDMAIPVGTSVQYADNAPNTLDLGDTPTIIMSLNGDDIIRVHNGYNVVYGGGGHDTVQYDYDRYDYALSQDPLTGDTQVITKSGDSLGVVAGDVETLRFRDYETPNDNHGYWGSTSSVTQATAAPVFRFFNVVNNSFFYTTSEAEAEVILGNSSELLGSPDEWPYVYQGATFAAASRYGGAVPLHRYFNTQTGHHFFTANEFERAYLNTQIRDGAWPFSYEGVAFDVYLDDPNAGELGEELAVHRFFSPSLNRHVFTASPSEALLFQQSGLWQYEGIGFYGERVE